MKTLGVAASQRGSAACLMEDGIVRYAAQEERFSRIRHDAGFPIAAIAYCLDHPRWRLSIQTHKFVGLR